MGPDPNNPWSRSGLEIYFLLIMGNSYRVVLETLPTPPVETGGYLRKTLFISTEKDTSISFQKYTILS
jgi:hypothetical protein